MQRSSQSIASLAAALAKAQCELINPEKSLVGIIKPETDDAAERLFRYASLASGLEIVRKTLGQHEIATVQTTAIDQSAGIVNLTTVLAHASGEWIASDWPVCAIADTAEPHRMGAALTYARRYALFTLVGIAGEDDLDAPDLVNPRQSSSSAKVDRSRRPGSNNGRLDSRATNLSDRTLLPRQTKSSVINKPGVLGAVLLDFEASARLREQMLGELNDIGTSDEAAKWARRRLAEKNRLNAEDAKHIEEAFRTKLLSFAAHHAEGMTAGQPEGGASGEDIDQSGPATEGRSASNTTAAKDSPTTFSPKASAVPEPTVEANEPKRKVMSSRPRPIDKSLLNHPEPRRIRDRDHVRFVAQQPCLICGRQPCDAHHLRFAQSQALGRKVSDEFTVPLCRGHHHELHRRGDEAAWWSKVGLDPLARARELWRIMHPVAMLQYPSPRDALVVPPT
jgi:ERF superfamily